jgi:hypothetical protein
MRGPLACLLKVGRAFCEGRAGARYNSFRMKRVRRWIFAVSATVSLMLCALSAILYVQSFYWHYDLQHKDFPRIQIHSTIYAADWRPGYFQIWRVGPLPIRSAPYADDGLFGWNHCVGWVGIHVFWFTDSLPGPPISQWSMLEISFWWFVIGTLALPIVWFVRVFHRSRKRLGNCCSSCGYDLRATPDRCPECGNVVEKSI